jgi:hypothetical protein
MIDGLITVWLLCGIGAAFWQAWLIRDDYFPRDFLMSMMLLCAGPIGLLFMASFLVGDDGEDEE